MARPTFEAERGEFVAKLREMGGSAGNVRLRERLGWGEDRYWRTHGSLLDEGTILRGRGKGGSVTLVDGMITGEDAGLPSEISLEAISPEAGVVVRELDLYAPAKRAIEDGWIRERGFDEALVEITGLAGRRHTGGTWTRPDLAVLATKAYPYLPGRFFEVITFEVKKSDAIDVTGVFEALSHLQFASLSYVVFCTNSKDFDSDYPDTERILNLAKDHGVGVIVAANINDYKVWDELVEPRRNNPDPEQANLFIGTCFSEDAKSRVVKWHK